VTRTPRRRILWPIWSEQGDALLERPAKARRGKSGHLPIKPANDALKLVRDSRRLCSRLRPPCTTKRARAEGRWPWALPVAPAGSARAHSPPIVRGRASRGWVSCGSVSCRIGFPAESTRSFHSVDPDPLREEWASRDERTRRCGGGNLSMVRCDSTRSDRCDGPVLSGVWHSSMRMVLWDLTLVPGSIPGGTGEREERHAARFGPHAFIVPDRSRRRG